MTAETAVPGHSRIDMFDSDDRIPMPFCVTADDIQTNFGDSVLRVEVRKTAGTHPKGEKINVR